MLFYGVLKRKQSHRITQAKDKRVFRALQVDPLRLIDFLTVRSGQNTADVLRHINLGCVYCGKKRIVDANYLLNVGDKITLFWRREEQNVNYRVVYESDSIVIVDKPAGLSSIPARVGGESLQSLLIRDYGNELRVLHRLDRQTSGLVVASKKRSSFEYYAKQVRAHRLNRVYLAVADGVADFETRYVKWRLKKASNKTIVVQGDQQGKSAASYFERLEGNHEFSLLRVYLETGRMHQIRVHAAAMGLPLVGDELYNKKLKKPDNDSSRLALHSHRLRFKCLKGNWIEVQSPLPDDLIKLFKS